MNLVYLYKYFIMYECMNDKMNFWEGEFRVGDVLGGNSPGEDCPVGVSWV